MRGAGSGRGQPGPSLSPRTPGGQASALSLVPSSCQRGGASDPDLPGGQGWAWQPPDSLCAGPAPGVPCTVLSGPLVPEGGGSVSSAADAQAALPPGGRRAGPCLGGQLIGLALVSPPERQGIQSPDLSRQRLDRAVGCWGLCHGKARRRRHGRGGDHVVFAGQTRSLTWWQVGAV